MNTLEVIPDIAPDDVVVEIYHGVVVADPFRWLEDHHSPRTRAWIEDQAKANRNHLDELPGREALAPRIAELLDQQTIGEILKFENILYYTKRWPGDEQPKLYRRNGLDGAEELLLDPGALGEGSSLSITIIDVSPNGKLLAYGLRSGGQGARRVRILDLETGRTLLDELPKGALRGFNFLPESNGFIYVSEFVEKPNEPKAVKRHFFGESITRDKTVFYGGRRANLRLVTGYDAKSCTAVHTAIRAMDGQNLTSIHLQLLSKCGNPLITLVEDSPDSWSARIRGDQLYIFHRESNGTSGNLVRVPLRAPDLGQATTVLAEGEERIQNWHIVGDRILTTAIENISTILRMYSLDGHPLGPIDLPEPGTASILGGDQDGCFYSFESYGRPREVYYFEFSTGKSVLFSSSAAPTLGLTVHRTAYAAQDGTAIPLTLLGKAEVLARGNAPTLLTAYGAAGVSLTPQYSFLATHFVRLGGVFAIAHVRGGGEYGLAWEQAGRRHNRPTVHKDFIRAAEYLVSSGTTDRERIAIAGGSNSGLLVGTAMTQRPDLFCAVICLAPIIDMLRYHRFDNTQFYIPQFGSADDAKDFPILLSYSPYHNVQDGVRYPALLMISGDADTRCDPMHARKFVARLQTATKTVSKSGPILLDWNPLRGHFATLPLATRIAALVDRLAFLCHHLRMEVA